jgi:hypothetical protein
MEKDDIITNNKKVCACKNCTNIGKTILEVKYIQKAGHFCKSCAKDLLEQGLALKAGETNVICNTIPESKEHTNPDRSLLSSSSKIIDGIIADLRITIDQIAINSNTAKCLILELARRFDETKRCEQSQICRKIKDILQDKIQEGKITEKWIEECLPPEYKRTYAKSEVSSLSKQAKRNAAKQRRKNKDIIAAHTQSTKSVLTTIDGHNDNGADDDDSNLCNDNGTEQAPNNKTPNQNTTLKDYDQRQALCSEIHKSKQAVGKQARIVTADQISATELEFTIPKEKYREIKAAMKSSRDSISVTFDKSGVLQHAEPDIPREK